MQLQVAVLAAVAARRVDVFSLPNKQPPVREHTANVSAREFLDLSRGWGTPAVFRGLAALSPAYTKWQTDEQLRDLYGDVRVNWEQEKVESRRQRAKSGTLSEFLDGYNNTGIYLVDTVPVQMQEDVVFPPFLTCGHQTRYLFHTGLWMSSGDTVGLIHSDSVDNLNCCFSGEKRIALWHPRNKTAIEWYHSGWRGNEANVNGVDYGGSAMMVDGRAVDLERFPAYGQMPWWEVSVPRGDCVHIPAGWYHHVRSTTARSITVNVGWYRDYAGAEVDAAVSVAGCRERSDSIAFSRCSYGYRGWDKHRAVNTEEGTVLTSCAGSPRLRGRPKHAEAEITPWLVATADDLRRAIDPDPLSDPVMPELKLHQGQWRVGVRRR